MTTVEALKNLYEHLGGDAADVADLTLNPELVAALSELEIGGGGGTTRTIYTDLSGQHGGDGQPSTPYPLFSDSALTHEMTMTELVALIQGGSFIITDASSEQFVQHYMRPVTGFISPDSAEQDAAIVAAYKMDEGLQAIYLGYYTGA